MADQHAKSYLIEMKIGARGFLGSLITNPRSKFSYSKFRIQYGRLKCKKQKVMPQRFFCAKHVSDDRSYIRMFVWAFFASLIMNLILDF